MKNSHDGKNAFQCTKTEIMEGVIDKMYVPQDRQVNRQRTRYGACRLGVGADEVFVLPCSVISRAFPMLQ